MKNSDLKTTVGFNSRVTAEKSNTPVSDEWIEKILRIAYASKSCGNSTTAVPTDILISILFESQMNREKLKQASIEKILSTPEE